MTPTAEQKQAYNQMINLLMDKLNISFEAAAEKTIALMSDFKDSLDSGVLAGEIIEYKGKEILINSDKTFTAYYSKHSAHLTKNCKTLEKAKAQIDKWIN